MALTATHINYFFTCKRKLWLFSKKITCEHESELVKIGKVHHQDIEKESLQIDNVKIDSLREGKVFELKKKNTAPEAAKYQVLYYLLKLKEKGIFTTGTIKYKENNRLEEVELTQANEDLLNNAIRQAELICQEQVPEAKRNKYCRLCSYYELCFS